MVKDWNDIVGMKVVGATKAPMPDVESEAGRIPASLVIDTSWSMHEFEGLLKEAAIQMIEATAAHCVAREKVDLEVISFNTVEQINIRIPAQEIYNLVDEQTSKIKPEFTSQLNFRCNGFTPTGYALQAAVNDLLDRYEKLKDAKKSPSSPILFFMSDGLPEVKKDIAQNHDSILKAQLERIQQLVSNNRLSVVAVEVGIICNPPKNDNEEQQIKQMHELMQSITGLQDSRHVCQAKDRTEISKFFSFTSSLLINSAEGDINLNERDLRGF